MSIYRTIHGVGSAGGADGATKEYVDAQDATTKAHATTLDNLRVLRAGDTMTGQLNMSGNQITELGAPIESSDASTAAFVLETAEILK